MKEETNPHSDLIHDARVWLREAVLTALKEIVVQEGLSAANPIDAVSISYNDDAPGLGLPMIGVRTQSRTEDFRSEDGTLDRLQYALWNPAEWETFVNLAEFVPEDSEAFMALESILDESEEEDDPGEEDRDDEDRDDEDRDDDLEPTFILEGLSVSVSRWLNAEGRPTDLPISHEFAAFACGYDQDDLQRDLAMSFPKEVRASMGLVGELRF